MSGAHAFYNGSIKLFRKSDDEDILDLTGHEMPNGNPSAAWAYAELFTAAFPVSNERPGNEAAFRSVFNNFVAHQSLSLDDRLSVAKALEVIWLDDRSVASINQSIEKFFYWASNDYDANALAARATPW